MCIAANTISELPWQVVLGIFVLTTAMIYATRKKLARAPLNPRAAARQREIEHRRQHRAESEVRDVLIELEHAAREITAQIDTRFHKLEALIRDSDRRIAELRSLAATEPTSTSGQRLDKERIATDHLDITVGDDGVESRPGDSTADRPSRSADYERVCALADRLLTVREIAAQVQRPLGEVELMLAMRSQRGGAGATATERGSRV